MEVSYRRRFHQSYMILEDGREPEEVYELSMLAYNRIPGLLAIETEIADGQVRFWYDITGKQSLADYLARRKVDSQLLELLFQGLEMVCQQLQEHLLEESQLVLEAEYLYLDFSGKKLGIAYFPGYHKDIRDSFRELMEVLLRRLLHSDKQGAAMAYEMYQLSLQKELSFADMLRRAMEAKKGQPESSGEMPRRNGGEMPRRNDGEVPRRSDGDAQRRNGGEVQRNDTGEVQKSYMGVGKEGSIQCADRFGEAQGRYIDKSEKARRKSRAVMVHSPAPGREAAGHFTKIKAYFAGLGLKSGKKEGWRSSRMAEEELPYVTAQEEEVTYKTELLYGGDEQQGILRYQGNGGQRDIKIEKDSFLLGKEDGEVDGCMTGKSVSRIHARISREDGNYYLEDMNSTNGTYLNGEQLEYRQKQKLAAGDRVMFGMEEYIFM